MLYKKVQHNAPIFGNFLGAAIIQERSLMAWVWYITIINSNLCIFPDLQAQYRRIISCRCTADTPQIDYSRYNAGRGQTQPGVLAATASNTTRGNQRLQTFRAQPDHSGIF